MSKGYPFPDVAKLERALTLRGWPLAVLADKAAIAVPVAYKALRGERLSIETINRIARAVLDHPPNPDDAIVRFMSTDD